MGPEWHLPQTEEDRVQWKKYDPNYMEGSKRPGAQPSINLQNYFPINNSAWKLPAILFEGTRKATKSSTMELQNFQIDLPFKPISSMGGMKIAVTSLLIES